MPYKLHLNLQQRAALRTAISFWENKEVQDRVSKFFESWDTFESYYTARERWYKLLKTLIDEWNKALLPQRVEAELIHITKMIGKTIFNWCLYVKHEYKVEEMNMVDNIYWTPYGTIDEVQILKSSWLTNPDLEITKVYNFACRYALVDCIDDLWHKIPTDIQNRDYDDIYMHFDQHILAYWKHCRDGDLHNLMTYLEIFAGRFNGQDRQVFNLIYDLDRSTEENMLRLSVHQGYYMAVKYFWEKLTEEEKDQSVLKCARITVSRYYHYQHIHESIRDYKKNKYVEICLFLINQMSYCQKKALFNEKLILDNSFYFTYADVKDVILDMILSVWPWQELFMPVLKDMLKYQDNDSKMACIFLDTVTYKFFIEHLSGYSIETIKYRCLLREAWLILPKSIKQKVVPHDEHTGFICNLLYVRDWDSLKLILHDPDIATVKNLFVSFGSYEYGQWVEYDEFQLLDKFIDEILRSEEEIKEFKQGINVWRELVMNDQLHLVDKLLDWRCSTPEERQSIRNGIARMGLIKI